MKHRAQCGITDYYGLAKSFGYLRLICSIIVPLITRRYKTNSLPCESLLLFSLGCSSRQDDIFNVSIWVKHVQRFDVSGCKATRITARTSCSRSDKVRSGMATMQIFRLNAHLAHGAWCAAGLRWTQTPVTNWHGAAPPGLTREQLPASEEWLDKAVSNISHRPIEPWEWLMKSNATAVDKIRPSQVMKDRGPGWGGAAGGGLWKKCCIQM